MIHLSFGVQNPYSNRFKSIWSKFGSTPFQYKYWETQLVRTNDIVSLNLEITRARDHAGINFELGLFSFNFYCKLYDSRHWNYLTNRWE